MKREGDIWIDQSAWDDAQRWLHKSHPTYESPHYLESEHVYWARRITPALLVSTMILAGVLLQSLATLHWWEGAAGPIGGLCGILSFVPIARRLGWWKSIAWAVGVWLLVAWVSLPFAIFLAPFIGLGY